MKTQEEKVYVAVGSDLQDGLGTLEWVLRKWASHSISIVILLHPAMSTNFVYTPFGKLPSSSVNDDKVEIFNKCEEGKAEKILSSKYIAFCGKVKAEILRIEKYDEPIHKVIVELISKHRIVKLVLSFTFMKSSSWKSRSAISGSFYIHRQKPEFCELFIICGGKMVFLKEENNEGLIEDNQGIVVGKIRERNSFKNWLGKMFSESSNSHEKSPRDSPSSSTTSNNSPDQWEKYAEEIEHYFHQLLSSNSDEETCEVANDASWNSLMELDMPKNMNAAERIEAMKIKIGKVEEVMQLKKKEAKANIERHTKAEWAISLCSHQIEELEARTKEDMVNQFDLKKDLHNTKEELSEIQNEVDERKNKLNSILEIQRELSNKLQLFSLGKTHAEAQLEKVVKTRAEMIQEIEEFRRQRDVLNRKIEFCREKDAIGMANRLSDLGFNYKEFTAEEIRAASDHFSERRRLKSAGDWRNVYRGRIKHTTVAIKLYDSSSGLPPQAFQAKVKLLSHIRHPHLVAMIGFCSDLNCIVFEYMHNGCLRDTLFSSGSKSRNGGLNWHARIRIAAEVCSGLGFLHQSHPRPIVHGNLNPSKILLDRNNVAKIHGFRLGLCHDESDRSSDMRAFGNLLLQLMTGRNWAGIVEEVIVTDRSALTRVLDRSAGEWPLDLAMELGTIAIRCLSSNDGLDMELATVIEEIIKVREKADNLVATGECGVNIEEGIDMEDSSTVPSVFLCPIFQDVMKNPHVAADGFSYELEAMDQWLRTGHDTSPMTNLRLIHKHLTPNHTLRSLIEDWHNRGSIPFYM